MWHFIVSICCSFMEGIVQAQSRWSAQYNIRTVSSKGRWDMPMHSFHLSLSHLRFIHAPHMTLSSTFLPSLSDPSLCFLTLLIPPNPTEHPPPPLTVILQYSFLPFMSISAHFAPGRQCIKSSDRQVLVLLLVLSETVRCRALASVWCTLH